MNPKVILIWYFIVGSACAHQCRCGRGGLCRGDTTHKLDCHCDIVSKGIFESRADHCDTLVDHCNAQKCHRNATCVQGFGTFFCTCAQGWAGEKCDYQEGRSQARMVAVWYPLTGQRRWIPTIVATKIPKTTKILFTMEHGQLWETTIASCQKTTWDEIFQRCESQRGGQDCSFLSYISTIATVFFNCYVPLPFAKSREISLEGLGPVGQYHDVRVLIYDKRGPIHLNASYRVFLESGLGQQCPYDVTFSGCSTTPTSAYEIVSNGNHILSVAVSFRNKDHPCFVKSKLYRWYFSPMYQTTDPILIGGGQTILVNPSNIGFTKGLVSVHVNVTFKDVVGSHDDFETAICYIKIIESNFEVKVYGTGLNYSCKHQTTILITTNVLKSNYPVDELIFTWRCPQELCRGVNLSNQSLAITRRFPCGDYEIALDVGHGKTSKTFHFEGQLHFVVPSLRLTRTGSEYTYSIKLYCEPICAEANPALPLSIVAVETPDLNSTFMWTAPFNNFTECDSNVMNNMLMIAPHTLEHGLSYTFSVSTTYGYKLFQIETIQGPRTPSCQIHPKSGTLQVDKFRIICQAQSEHLPLTYWVYEGIKRDLVTISTSSVMENVDLTHYWVWVDVVDSKGLKGSTNMIIKANPIDPDHRSRLFNRIPSRINGLFSLLRENDFGEMANEINSITRFAGKVLRTSWKHKLIYFLAQIRTCIRIECIMKSVTSVLHLISLKAESDNHLDDLILKSGATIYRVSQSLEFTIDAVGRSTAYDVIPVLTSIHDAAHLIMKLVDPLVLSEFISEDARRIRYRKVQKGSDFARLALSEMGLSITKHLPHPAMPFELVSDASQETFTVISHFPDYINCVVSLEESSYFEFPPDEIAQLEIADMSVSVTVVRYKKGNFWWVVPMGEKMGETVEVYFHQWSKLVPTPKTVPIGKVTTYIRIPKDFDI